MIVAVTVGIIIIPDTDYGHPERAFFSKIPNFRACANKFSVSFEVFLADFGTSGS